MAKNNKRTKQASRSMVVVSTEVDKYKYRDIRALKPICVDCKDHPQYPMSVAFQETDKVNLSKGKQLEYFVPNNIALLLSNSRKSLDKAEVMYKEQLLKHIPSDEEKFVDQLWSNCSLVSDYIELMQTAIVFGYTALEAFANISIPENYTYISKPNSKGIKEQFSKEAVERWVRLQDKLNVILPDIYNTSVLNKQKFWPHFIALEECRNNIIHQKTIDRTSFLFEYFKPKIFEILRVPEKIIVHFYEANGAKNKQEASANLMWPWLKGNSTFPVMTSPDEILQWQVDLTRPSMQARVSRSLNKAVEKNT
ncbi:hypothetical protein AADU81_003158 [Vibrio alginolyticus]